ncbi:hypothetical protein CEXT_612501 [Caerostris extrusa]|uniref:Uncharacterized protein n=1 Tax=Caerostris extrusa TaxID=172846 RepID=A0AAV4XLQ4_CAEEX|nr:hypothetical protein CEXT_612501 [Caerostris extrusa]
MQKILLRNKESPASVPLSISVSTASDVTACSAENCIAANQKLFDTFKTMENKTMEKNQDYGKDTQELKHVQKLSFYAAESASEFMSSYWRNLARLSSDMPRDQLSASEFIPFDLINLPRQSSDMSRDQVFESDWSSALRNLSRQASGMSRDQMCDTENNSESEILTKLKFAVEKIERQNEILNSDGSVLEKKIKNLTSTKTELYSLEDCENHLVQIEDLYSYVENFLKDTEQLLTTYNEYNEISFTEDPDFVENNSILHERFQVGKLRLGLTYMNFNEKFSQFISYKNELELLHSVLKDSLN